MPDPFQLSSDYVDALIAQSPLFATNLGIGGADDRWDDLTLENRQRFVDELRPLHAAFVSHRAHIDRDQRICARVMARNLADTIDAFDHGDHFEDVRHMAATFHRLRSVFDITDKTTADGWANIVSRLATIDVPLLQYQSLLAAGIAAGKVTARRQVISMIEQVDNLAGNASSFDGLLSQAAEAGLDTPELAAAVAHAKVAMSHFGAFLRSEYLPNAAPKDGVGEARYRRAGSRFAGMDVDPHEAYAWGWEELARLLAEADRVGQAILADGSFDDVKDLLETDPGRAAHSPGEFAAFIEQRQFRALHELDGTHFEVPEQVQNVTVTIAPPGGPLSAYYMRPSEDFSRPGGIWFSIGDQTVFPLYHWVSTAYHEGFPGHHLQIGTAMTNADSISRGQRLAVFYPGYSEGWALYAERLMGELGYLEKPEYEFGMLGKHLYRATRIVVDIGLHLDLAIPDDAPLFPGEAWTFERAVDYMQRYGFRTEEQAPNEVLRYLGWPGQAISYKLGEREILRAREQAMQSPDYDAKAFHSRVLGHGSLPLELLPEVVLD